MSRKYKRACGRCGRVVAHTRRHRGRPSRPVQHECDGSTEGSKPVSDYIDKPTMIRIFREGDGWSIDGIDEHGSYTEAVWDHYDGKPMTRSEALLHAPEFAAEHGWGRLPVVETEYER